MSNHIVGGFTPLIDDLVQELGLFPAAIYGRIWRYCQGESGTCTASLDSIASSIGVSVRTVTRYIKVLIDAGYIEDLTPKRRYHPHRYRLTKRAKLHFEVHAVVAPQGHIITRDEDKDEDEEIEEAQCTAFATSEDALLEEDDTLSSWEGDDDHIDEEDPFTIEKKPSCKEEKSGSVSYNERAICPQKSCTPTGSDCLSNKMACQSNKDTIEDTIEDIEDKAAAAAITRANLTKSHIGVGGLLAKAGIIVGGPIQSEMWQDLYEEAGRDLFCAALEEAIRSRAGPPTIRYVEAIVRRCLAEGVFPGRMRGTEPVGGTKPVEGTRQPVRLRWRNPVTGEIGEI